MKKSVFLLIACLFSLSASVEWFPFKEVNHKWNISLNGGYSPEKKVGMYGLGVTFRGFHLTVGGLGSSHKHDMNVGTWTEKASVMVQAGYQIPIVKAFRVIPVVGVAGIGETVTDGYTYYYNNSPYVINKVSSDIKYKFDYGAHFVFNHRKLIVNLSATRYTLLGGLGLEF